jgi:hypothetical protein
LKENKYKIKSKWNIGRPMPPIRVINLH